MPDIIFIENISSEAVIGIHAYEKAAPQKLIISIELGTDIRPAAADDDLQQALDYDAISRFIDEFVRASSYELLETLAENLAAAILQSFAAQDVKLRLQKPGAIALTQQVGVSIYRQRDQ